MGHPSDLKCSLGVAKRGRGRPPKVPPVSSPQSPGAPETSSSKPFSSGWSHPKAAALQQINKQGSTSGHNLASQQILPASSDVINHGVVQDAGGPGGFKGLKWKWIADHTKQQDQERRVKEEQAGKEQESKDQFTKLDVESAATQLRIKDDINQGEDPLQQCNQQDQNAYAGKEIGKVVVTQVDDDKDEIEEDDHEHSQQQQQSQLEDLPKAKEDEAIRLKDEHGQLATVAVAKKLAAEVAAKKVRLVRPLDDFDEGMFTPLLPTIRSVNAMMGISAPSQGNTIRMIAPDVKPERLDKADGIKKEDLEPDLPMKKTHKPSACAVDEIKQPKNDVLQAYSSVTGSTEGNLSPSGAVRGKDKEIVTEQLGSAKAMMDGKGHKVAKVTQVKANEGQASSVPQSVKERGGLMLTKTEGGLALTKAYKVLAPISKGGITNLDKHDSVATQQGRQHPASGTKVQAKPAPSGSGALGTVLEPSKGPTLLQSGNTTTILDKRKEDGKAQWQSSKMTSSVIVGPSISSAEGSAGCVKVASLKSMKSNESGKGKPDMGSKDDKASNHSDGIGGIREGSKKLGSQRCGGNVRAKPVTVTKPGSSSATLPAPQSSEPGGTGSEVKQNPESRLRRQASAVGAMGVTDHAVAESIGRPLKRQRADEGRGLPVAAASGDTRGITATGGEIRTDSEAAYVQGTGGQSVVECIIEGNNNHSHPTIDLSSLHSFTDLWAHLGTVLLPGTLPDKLDARLVYMDTDGDWMMVTPDEPWLLFAQNAVKILISRNC